MTDEARKLAEAYLSRLFPDIHNVLTADMWIIEKRCGMSRKEANKIVREAGFDIQGMCAYKEPDNVE